MTTLFVPGVGFRSSDGLGLASPVTIAREDGTGLRVMWLAATELGTEISIEIRDGEYERRCADGRSDYRLWHEGTEVWLRDDQGRSLSRRSGPGSGFSFGQHEFGQFGQRLIFAPVRRGTRHLALEVRGNLGEWDVPVDLVPLTETDARAAVPIDAQQERNGITIGVAAAAQTADVLALDLEATSTDPVSALEVRASMYGEEGLSLIDGAGRRLDESSFREGLHMSRAAAGRAVALFPRVTSHTVTLVIPQVVVQEPEGELAIDLPVHAPVDAAFGRHPVTVRYAAAVDRLRTVSGESSRPGLEIQLNGVWRDDRRVLRPGPVHVDGVHRDYSVSGYGGPEPAYGTVSVPLDDAESARKVRMSKPIIAVRGPWEIPFSVPS